jgi:DNA transposition AAA+ family ATPase
LNVSAIARRIGISQSVMASYLCGIKKPSAVREHEIKEAIRQTGRELAGIL